MGANGACACVRACARAGHKVRTRWPHIRMIQDGRDGDGSHRGEAGEKLACVNPPAKQPAQLQLSKAVRCWPGQCTQPRNDIRAPSGAGMLSRPGGRSACCAECNDSASPDTAHPLTRLLPPLYEESPPPPPKKRYGIGTITYMKAVSIGHQLCQRTHPSICSSTPREKDPARPPVPQPGPIITAITAAMLYRTLCRILRACVVRYPARCMSQGVTALMLGGAGCASPKSSPSTFVSGMPMMRSEASRSRSPLGNYAATCLGLSSNGCKVRLTGSSAQCNIESGPETQRSVNPSGASSASEATKKRRT